MPEFTLESQEHLRGDARYLKQSIIEHLYYTIGKDQYTATKRDLFYAVAYAVRDQLIGRWIKTQQQYYDADVRRVYYISMEFLMGRTLENSLVNLGIVENCRKALHDIGLDLEELCEIEYDAGLGNGGLGRLAACFLDSMATLGIPGYGYGIRYDFGIFTQRIEDGYQIEKPDNWLRYGNPWELCRSEYLYPIQFYGHVMQYKNGNGQLHCQWLDTAEVIAVANDTPIPGYANDTVNTLRLWQAKSARGFDFTYFNHGDYVRAIEDIAITENISRVLYPNDNIFEGKELRLKQEYFLVSATIQDILRRYKKRHTHLDQFADKVAIQLNDTHPALAIAELMRLLVDKEGMQWDQAWRITQATFSYTNHTILPEAMERWTIPLLEHVLPRHVQIIYEINRRWLLEVHSSYPGDENKLRKLSLIEESTPKKVNMAYLSIVGSHRVNGVSKLHSKLLQDTVFHEFYLMQKDKFVNKTNGITPRRWLKCCNPQLAHLIDQRIGSGWVTDLYQLHKLEEFMEDPELHQALWEVKKANKKHLSQVLYSIGGVAVDLDSLFDCQVKRIHEYKRQLLNVFHVIHLYNRIKDDPTAYVTPRTVLFSGKAAPGYFLAKLIIKLIHAVAEQVNRDPHTKGKLQVFFLPNYRVTLAEKIIPAADLSEQISTAGTEASGTGNMKFALNGALTIGTLDGANIEILEEVGEENIFIFGLKTEEIEQWRQRGYNPRDIYNQNADLHRILDMISGGWFSAGDKALFQPIVHSILEGGDEYYLCADFVSYMQTQELVSQSFQDKTTWIKKVIKNIASMGAFSSDRTIMEYANDIWFL